MAKINRKKGDKYTDDGVEYIVVDDKGGVKKVTDLVIKDYDEKAAVESYRKKFKDKRSDDPVINKLKDWLFENLKLNVGGELIIDLLGGSKYNQIVDYLNSETVIDTDNSATIPEVSDCIDIEEFIALSNDIKQTWAMVRGKSVIVGNTSTISGLKAMFGEESKTFKKIKKILSRKQTLFESLFPVGEFSGSVTSEMVKLSTK